VLAGPVAFSTAAADKAPGLVLGIGLAGIAALILGAALRVSDLLPVGIAFAGASYLLFALFGEGDVDLRAPLVAGALVLAAELAYSSLEPPVAPASRWLWARRASRVAFTAAGAVAVAALVLLVSLGDTGSGGLVQALGVASAVSALGLLAWLARRLT
jgi:hypothetical protein